ncbi:MAG: hypothetical protein FJY85_07650, partial [Deltaproteobacteria bacterium]|nr:hypothetical protein [Deltaproteobacteria bacterium]
WAKSLLDCPDPSGAGPIDKAVRDYFDDDDGDNPFARIVDSDEFDDAVRDSCDAGETIFPPRVADLWLTRDAMVLERTLRSLLKGVTEPIVAPVFTPLAVIKGEQNRLFLWGDGESSLPHAAEAKKLPIREALLTGFPKRSITIVESAHPLVPSQRMILCMPPADPDPGLFSRYPVKELTLRAVVWFEKTSGAIAAKDVQSFLKSKRKLYPIHIVMQDVLSAVQAAIAGDESEPVTGTVRQFTRFVDEDFCPWMHLTK